MVIPLVNSVSYGAAMSMADIAVLDRPETLQ
jgi:hypothetical protein